MTISQLTVRNLPKGKNGQLYGNGRLYHEESFDSNENRAAEVWTVEVTAAVNSTVYSFSAFGEEVSYTSDATATLVEIADGLADAFVANPITNGVGAAVSDGVDTVTITATYDGIAMDLASTDANLALTEATPADEGDVLPFGRAVVDDGNGGVRLYLASSDAPDDIVGITRYTYDEAATVVGSSDVPGYPVGRQAIVLLTGRMYVEGAEAENAAKGDALYVGGAGDERGKFFTAAGVSREQVTDGTIKWHKAGVVEIKRGF